MALDPNILGKEIKSREPKIPFCRLNKTKHIFSSVRLPNTVQNPARNGFVPNNGNTIDINCVFKTAADDVRKSLLSEYNYFYFLFYVLT